MVPLLLLLLRFFEVPFGVADDRGAGAEESRLLVLAFLLAVSKSLLLSSSAELSESPS